MASWSRSGYFLRISPLLLFAWTLSVASFKTCYYPDGSVSANDVPCNSTASNSGCCGANAWCTANGLCMGNMILSRGSCTDQTWSDCPQFCRNQNPSGGTPIMACRTSPPTFVCDLNDTMCQTGDTSFTMTENDFTLNDDQVSSAVAAQGSSTSTATSSTVTVTVASSAETTDTGAMAGIGVGVGAPLLLALLTVSFLLWKERRKTKKLQAGDYQQPMQPVQQIPYYDNTPSTPHQGPMAHSTAPMYQHPTQELNAASTRYELGAAKPDGTAELGTNTGTWNG